MSSTLFPGTIRATNVPAVLTNWTSLTVGFWIPAISARIHVATCADFDVFSNTQVDPELTLCLQLNTCLHFFLLKSAQLGRSILNTATRGAYALFLLSECRLVLVKIIFTFCIACPDDYE